MSDQRVRQLATACLVVGGAGCVTTAAGILALPALLVTFLLWLFSGGDIQIELAGALFEVFDMGRRLWVATLPALAGGIFGCVRLRGRDRVEIAVAAAMTCGIHLFAAVSTYFYFGR